MSSDSDSDDIPALVPDTSESEDDICINNANASNAICAKLWIAKFKGAKKKSKRESQERVIKIYVLSPFLFGQSKQPNKWIKWAYECDMLRDTVNFRIDNLSDRELNVVDLMEKAVLNVCKYMSNKEELAATMDLVDKCDRKNKLKEMLSIVQGWDRLGDWREKLQSSNNDHLTFALMFAARQYVEHVKSLIKEGKDKEEDFEQTFQQDDNKADMTKYPGNHAFSMGKYKQAQSIYTKAIVISPYSHILYGNRAQAYLKTKDYRHAVSDGKRTVVLNPKWGKGQFRYAEAYFEMGKVDKAIEINKQAMKLCAMPDVEDQKKNMADFESQRKKFLIEKERLLAKKKAQDSDGDVPDLVSSEDEVPNPGIECQKQLKKFKKMKTKDYGSDSDEAPELVSDEDDDDEDADTKDKRTSAQLRQAQLEFQSEKFKHGLMMSQKMKKQEAAERKKKEEEGRIKAKEKIRLKKKKEKEERMKKQEAAKLSPQDQSRVDLQENMKQGSVALQEERSRAAQHCYSKALQQIAEHQLQYFDLEEVDYALLKFAYGTACVESGEQKAIVEGIEKFENILSDHEKLHFVLAYLGLGRAYQKQNRFEDAIKQCKIGIDVSNDNYTGVHKWPGTQLFISQTKPGEMQKALRRLIEECLHPPRPDAVCRYGDCKLHNYKIQIYFTDPDFKGFVRLCCVAKCITDYHPNCWRKVKSVKNLTDKDFLTEQCLTPDCGSLIMSIYIYDAEGTVKKEYIAADVKSDSKPDSGRKEKTQASSQKKMQKKLTRKEMRRQKKFEAKQDNSKENKENENENVDIIEDIEKLEEKVKTQTKNTNSEIDSSKQNYAGKLPDNSVLPADISELTEELPDHVTVLRKEDTDTQYKSVNSKPKNKSKKRNKEKTVLSLGEFVGETLENQEQQSQASGEAGDLEDFDDAISTSSSTNIHSSLDPENPFTVPDTLRHQVEAFESTLPKGFGVKPPNAWDRDRTRSPVVLLQETVLTPEEQTIVDCVYSFFEDVLKAHGPQHVESELLSGNLTIFPPEVMTIIQKAGGLKNFLLQKHSFACYDDVVCLIQDAGQAKKVSEKLLGEKNSTNSWANRMMQQDNDISGARSSSPRTTVPVVSTPSNDAQKTSKKLFSPGQFPSIEDTLGVNDNSSVGKTEDAEILPLSFSSIASIVSNSSSDNGEKSKIEIQKPKSPKKKKKSKKKSTKTEEASVEISADTKEIDAKVTEETKNIRSENMKNIDHSQTGKGDEKETIDLEYKMEENMKLSVAEEFKKLVHGLAKIEQGHKEETQDDNVNAMVTDENGKLDSEKVNSLEQDAIFNDSKLIEINKEIPLSNPLPFPKQKPIGSEREFLDIKNTNHSSSVLEGLNEGGRTVEGNSPPETQKEPPQTFSKAPGTRPFPGLQPGIRPTFGMPKDLVHHFQSPTRSSPTDYRLAPWERKQQQPIPVMPVQPIAKTFPRAPTPQGSSDSPLLGLPVQPNVDHIRNIQSLDTLDLEKEQVDSINSDDAVKIVNTILSNDESDDLVSNECGSLTVFKDRAVNTVPFIDPHEEERQKLQMDFKSLLERHQQLEAQWHESQDKLTQIQNRSNMEIKDLTKEIEERRDQIKELKTEKTALINKNAEEAKKWTAKKKKIEDSLKNAKENSRQLAEKEEKLKKDIAEKEKIINDLFVKINADRDKTVSVNSRFEQEKGMLQQQLTAEKQRAQNAEVQLLKLKLEMGMEILSRSLTEAQGYYSRFSTYVKKQKEDGQPVQPHVQSSVELWDGIVSKLKAMILHSKSEFEEQITLVKNGRELSSMVELPIPKPPPVPTPQMIPSQIPASKGIPPGARLPPGNMAGLGGMRPPMFAPPHGVPKRPAGIMGQPPSLGSLSMAAQGQENPTSTNQQSLTQPPGLPRVPPQVQARQPGAPPGLHQKGTVNNRAPGAGRPTGKASTTGKASNSFEKIMSTLITMFPQTTRGEITSKIQDLRSLNNGSLSGMSLEEIVNRVSGMLMDGMTPQPPRLPGFHGLPAGLGMPTHLASNSGANTPGNGTHTTTQEIFEEEEDPCIICHEELKRENESILECRHRFHTECIRKWFREQSTCPTCRVHALLPDDFPSLA